jgi:hypothetical protein
MKTELAVAGFVVALVLGNAPGMLIAGVLFFAVVALIVWWP